MTVPASTDGRNSPKYVRYRAKSNACCIPFFAYRKRLTGAGRTDTGVHASHQVCHLDVNEDVLKRCVGHMDVPPVIALTRRLQRMLPADIAIRGIAPAPDGFDARFSALERTYVYRIADRSSEVDPRTRNFVAYRSGRLSTTA